VDEQEKKHPFKTPEPAQSVEFTVADSETEHVGQGVDHDPEKLSQSPSQLSQDLATVKANHPAVPEKLEKWHGGGIRRNKVILRSLGFLLFIVLLAGLFSMLNANRQSESGKNQAMSTVDHPKDLLAKGWTLYFGGKLDEAKDQAQKAWNLTKENKQTPEYADSCSLLGSIDLEKLEQNKQPVLLANEAEQFLKEAISHAPKSDPSAFDRGKPSYMRDLANLYLYENKWQPASVQLDEVLAGAGKSVLDLKLTGTDADLLRQFIRLYWGQGRELEAAGLTIALSNPSMTPNLKPATHIDFAGHWEDRQVNQFFNVYVNTDRPNQLTAKVQTDMTRFDLQHDFQASGIFEHGAIAHLSWQVWGKHCTAKLYRVGDFMLWRGGDPPERGSNGRALARTEEVLSRTAAVDAKKMPANSGAPLQSQTP
jgi:tetratricopeptide (TPR) repeat protein